MRNKIWEKQGVAKEKEEGGKGKRGRERIRKEGRKGAREGKRVRERRARHMKQEEMTMGRNAWKAGKQNQWLNVATSCKERGNEIISLVPERQE